MSRAKAILLVVAGLLLAASGAARAGGFALAEQSILAGGTGSAGTARGGDASAAWFNPAALADGGGTRVAIGILAAMPSIRADAMDDSWSARSETAVSTPPHIQASHAVGDWAFGVALGVPFGGGVTWPEAWAGRHEIVSSRIEVFRAAPFVAWGRGPVRVAAGVHVDAMRLRIHRGLDFVETEGHVHLDLSDTGVGVDLAAYFQATRELALGVAYKSRTSLELTGGADFEAPDAFNGKTMDQHARADMTLPDRLAAGAHWRRGPLAVVADVELVFWRVNQELVIDFEHDATPDAVQRNQWSSTVALRGGAEYLVAPRWIVRGGGFVDPTPAPSETLSPSSPDSTRVGITVGASRSVTAQVHADLFYEYMHLLGRETGNMDALQAQYGGRAQMLGIGVRYQR